MLPNGMTHMILVVRDFEQMDTEVRNKITSLVTRGIHVLKLHAKCTRQKPYEKMEVRRGRGSFYEGYGITEVLEMTGIAPDIRIETNREDTKIDFIHRATPDADIYFIAISRLIDLKHHLAYTTWKEVANLKEAEW